MCVCLNYFKTYSEDEETGGTRGRQGRQQTGGDTYTLEISFPAVKYVFHSQVLLSLSPLLCLQPSLYSPLRNCISKFNL